MSIVLVISRKLQGYDFEKFEYIHVLGKWYKCVGEENGQLPVHL